MRRVLVLSAVFALLVAPSASASSTKSQVRKAALRYLHALERADARTACDMLSRAGLEDAGYRDRRACRSEIHETGGTGAMPLKIHRIVLKTATQADVFVDDGDVELSRYPHRGWRVDVG
jgi:hypothetical protein